MGQLTAINKSQAVVEFELDGTIITANDNFLNAMGYTLAEVQGRHHSMFVEAAVRDGREYHEFWERLNRGEYTTGEVQTPGKRGQADLDSGFLQSHLRPRRSPLQSHQVCHRHHAAENAQC